MRRLAGRSMVLRPIALSALLVVLVSTSALALGDSREAAWCYDGSRWLLYAEGVPGSASPQDLTACLSRSAERGQVMAFDVQLVEGGAPIDAGDSSLFWTLPALFALELKVTAYRNHAIFGDNCERAFEVRSGTVRMIDPGYPCVGKERIRQDARTLTEVDFTVFVADGQFVVDGLEGWYHVARKPIAWRPGPAPLGEIVFRGVNGSVWVTADVEHVGTSIYDIHQPVVNTAHDARQFREYDWEIRVRNELIPLSFDRTAYYLLPDWDAYWDEVRDWLDAVVEDLFHGRAQPVQLRVLDELSCVAYADIDARAIATSCGSALTILHEFGHILAGNEDAHGGRFVATMLMLWERYIPGFDAARARELTQRYAVEVARPVAVEPVSYRTRTVHDLFAKTAPLRPSDHTPINADDLLLRVVLQLGTTYDLDSRALVATPQTAPKCTVTEQYSDGTTYETSHGPRTEFSINPGGEWNGLSLSGFSSFSDDGDYGSFVKVTPTVPGRVRVKVTTLYPGGYSQEERLVGYSEIVVVDPAGTDQ